MKPNQRVMNRYGSMGTLIEQWKPNRAGPSRKRRTDVRWNVRWDCGLASYAVRQSELFPIGKRWGIEKSHNVGAAYGKPRPGRLVRQRRTTRGVVQV